MSRNTLVRVVGTFENPQAAYVKSITKTGGFAITRNKSRARRFTPDTATLYASHLQENGNTRMTFDTCPAEVDNAGA